MDTDTHVDSEPGGSGSSAQDISDTQIPENSVQYILFPLDSQHGVQHRDARKHLAQIESIRQSAMKVSNSLTKDYIWQKDEFNLELRSEQGLTFLTGITDYGDAVEDEWLIVYILRELTKSHPDLWVRVFDTDGEFLLIEAANVLPKWLSPEIDRNRVWIHQGKLLIIPLEDGADANTRLLTLPHAVEIIRTKADNLIHSAFVEAEAFYRLEKYPDQISASLHHSLVTIPRRAAFVLHSLPKSIAPAVEAFYLRDPTQLKRIFSPSALLNFPPDDLITVSVRFSKVLFAQLHSQRFSPPPIWQSEFQSTQKRGSSKEAQRDISRLDLGIKLTCGLEMLAFDAGKSRSRVVRELAIVLDDLNEDGADALPSDEEIASWKDVSREDSEAWLDINYDDFERELDGKRPSDGKTTGFGDVKTQSDLRKIVSRFEAFLNDDAAGVEGAELDEMDYDDDEEDSDEESEGEDKEISFDEEEFSRMMREMMGFPPQNKRSGTQVPEPDSDDESQQVQELATAMEAELNRHGALKLDPVSDKPLQLEGKARSVEAEGKGKGEEDSDEGEDVDVDFNLAKNLLESFKSQAGMAGPAGNLLGMMGFQLPRDEDDGEQEEAKERPSQGSK